MFGVLGNHINNKNSTTNGYEEMADKPTISQK